MTGTVNILAIETATEACSVALAVAGEIHESFAVAPRRHTELILPMIESLLAEAGVRPVQLDCIAFGAGPGAFTGVRLATSIAQGLALPHDTPTLGLSSLEALAVGAARRSAAEGIVATLDARRGEVYWGAYRIGPVAAAGPAPSVTVVADRVTAPAAVDIAQVSPGDSGAPNRDAAWSSCGSGVAAYSEIAARYPPLDGDDRFYPHAGDIVRLALGRLALATAPDGARPIYFRTGV